MGDLDIHVDVRHDTYPTGEVIHNIFLKQGDQLIELVGLDEVDSRSLGKEIARVVSKYSTSTASFNEHNIYWK